MHMHMYMSIVYVYVRIYTARISYMSQFQSEGLFAESLSDDTGSMHVPRCRRVWAGRRRQITERRPRGVTGPGLGYSQWNISCSLSYLCRILF